MIRPARLHSAFTLFAKLLSLPEHIARLFRTRHTESRPVRLASEAMEDRVVPSAPTPAYTFNGSSSTPSLVDGQTVVVRETLTGNGGYTPTGSVAFTLSQSGTTIGTWTEALAAGSGTTAAAAPLDLALKAGSYTLTAAYPGDAHNDPLSAATILSVTVGAAPSTAPASEAPLGTCPPGLLTDAASAGSARVGYSAAGVDYATGALVVKRTDLSSSALGSAWGVDWSWTSAGGEADGVSGAGATQAQFAHLIQINGDASIALVASATSTHFFDYDGTGYRARFAVVLPESLSSFGAEMGR